MMYYMGETFEVDEVEMRDMASSKMKEVSYTIHSDGEVEDSDNGMKRKKSLHSIGAPVRKEYFKQNDITDLRIELETASDCLDFINDL